MSAGPARRVASAPAQQQVPAQSRGAASRLLGDFLRLARKDQGLTLQEAALLIRGSSSKISRLERGESPAKERDVWDLVRHYKVPEEKFDDVHGLLRQIRTETKGHRYSDVTPGFLRRLISLEGSASRIFVYENHVVPGLLQIKDYARVLVKAAMPTADEATVDRYVRDRMDRAELFRSPQRPELVVVLDEGVLRRQVGGPTVMRRQLEHLRKFADMGEAHVSVGILPFEDDGTSLAPSFPVTHLRMQDGGPSEIVYVELMESAEYVTEPGKVDQYRTMLTELMHKAVAYPRNLDLLGECIERSVSLERKRASGSAT
ncbi:helix-turn-helix domain-containing protein [Streptomyces silvensis]|uniref:helix-turn-helix domain-containing protein n=1 Tax=Streptomyces silvensis TaxID=1765722 RepID=UPI00099E734E|nr:helix-turn-helix transcriptional regulator [Streptomyces silvensis]